MSVLHNLHAIEIDRDEVGVTVRLGEKWQKMAPVGSTIALCECSDRCVGGPGCGDTEDSCASCDIVGAGVVTDKYYGVFRDVPARLLEHEHERRSRVYSGLLASMQKAYGGWTDFDEHSLVTVLTYERIS